MAKLKCSFKDKFKRFISPSVGTFEFSHVLSTCRVAHMPFLFRIQLLVFPKGRRDGGTNGQAKYQEPPQLFHASVFGIDQYSCCLGH